MSNMFDAMAEELAGTLRENGAVLPVAVVRTIPGTPDPSAPWDPVEPVTQTFVIDGWPEDWTEELLAGGMVEGSDLRVLVLTHGAPALPEVGDVLTVAGITGTVVALMPDTSGAVLGVQVRR